VKVEVVFCIVIVLEVGGGGEERPFALHVLSIYYYTKRCCYFEYIFGK
jgi:hypothetical protein